MALSHFELTSKDLTIPVNSVSESAVTICFAAKNSCIVELKQYCVSKQAGPVWVSGRHFRMPLLIRGSIPFSGRANSTKSLRVKRNMSLSMPLKASANSFSRTPSGTPSSGVTSRQPGLCRTVKRCSKSS